MIVYCATKPRATARGITAMRRKSSSVRVKPMPNITSARVQTIQVPPNHVNKAGQTRARPAPPTIQRGNAWVRTARGVRILHRGQNRPRSSPHFYQKQNTWGLARRLLWIWSQQFQDMTRTQHHLRSRAGTSITKARAQQCCAQMRPFVATWSKSKPGAGSQD